MATHSSILAWRIPGTEKPGRLQSTGWQRVRHTEATASSHACTCILRGSSPRTRGKQTLEEPLSRKWFNPPLKRVVCFLLNPPGCLSVPISLLINLLNYFLFLWWNSFPEGRKARQHWGPGFKLWSEFEPRSLVKPLQPPHSTPEDGNMTFNSLQMPLPVMYYAHFSFNSHRSAHCLNIFFLYFICAPFLWV